MLVRPGYEKHLRDGEPPRIPCTRLLCSPFFKCGLALPLPHLTFILASRFLNPGYCFSLGLRGDFRVALWRDRPQFDMFWLACLTRLKMEWWATFFDFNKRKIATVVSIVGLDSLSREFFFCGGGGEFLSPFRHPCYFDYRVTLLKVNEVSLKK